MKGKVGEPVAVETCLGWVLSGPTKGSDVDGRVNVNFVTQQNESELQHIWDLETLGIKGGDDVHEALIDKIEFNCVRYSVKLLGNKSMKGYQRITGQVKRLNKEPNVLKEEQLNSGVIEEVAEPERKESVHYLPHRAVIRRDAKTTKLSVVVFM